MYAFNATAGQKLWFSTPPLNGGFSSSPAVENGYVYIAGALYYQNSYLYCINASTGKLIWTYTTNSSTLGAGITVSSPVVDGNRVYVGSICLDAQSGKELWSTPNEFGESSPAVANGSVYVNGRSNMYALNSLTGSELWSYPTGGGYSSPSVVNGRVYVGSVNDWVYCFDAVTGAKIWNFTAGWKVDSSPAVVGSFVLVGCWDGNVYCLNASSGGLLWSYQIHGGPVSSSPAVAGDYIYVGSWGTQYWETNATMIEGSVYALYFPGLLSSQSPLPSPSIPEFPPLAILPILIAATTAALAYAKEKRCKQAFR